MPEPRIALTRAQRNVLRHLWADGDGAGKPFTGGSLVALYEERWRVAEQHYNDQRRAQGYDPFPVGDPGTDRRHAWRRTGGRVLMALRNQGVMVMTTEEITRGMTFRFTPAGAAYAEAMDEPWWGTGLPHA